MRYQWMIACLASLTVAIGAAVAAEPVKVSTVEGLTEYRLDNGLRVVIFPEPSQEKVTVNMTVLVGSRHEGYGEAGMAHLLEHMLFKPTAKHPHPDQDLEARGAKYNGTTWVDRTNYFETLPATVENLEWAIEWEADRLVNCTIKGEDLASEMTVVRNEFEMGENSPSHVLEQRIFATAYEWHNYGKSTIGNRADIERVPVDNLRAFYKRYYRPDNVVLFVGGRLDEAKTLALVQKYFGPLQNPSEPIRLTYTDEPPQDGERQVTLRRVGKVAVAGVAYHIPAATDPEYAATAVLEATLTADKTGRLYKSLVERRRAAKIQGTAYAWHDPGAIFISAEVVPGVEPTTVVDAIADTIEEVLEGEITEAEVARAKLQFRKYLDQIADDTPKLLVELTESAAIGDWRMFFINRDRIEKVTAADVNRVARKYLQSSNRTVGIYVPTEQAERTTISPPPDINAIVQSYKGREEAAAGEAFDPSPSHIEARVKRSTIEGVKVTMLPKKTRGRTVALTLRLRYGSVETLFGKAQVCEFVPTLMARATKSLSSEQLADKLDELQTTLSASGAAGEATFTIQTKRDQLVPALDVLRQVLREPSMLPTEFEILKQRRMSELEAMTTEPQGLAPRLVSQKLNPYPPGDVRHQPSLTEEFAIVSEIDAAAVNKVYQQFLSAQAGELAIVGDFEPSEIKEVLANTLGGWKSKVPYERIVRRVEELPKPDSVKILTPDKANATYFAGLLMPVRDDNPDYPALVIGNEILGGSGFASRLMSRIREKEGLSYGVGSALRASALDTRSTLTVYAICNPAVAERVEELVHEEMAKLLTSGVTDSELSDSKEGWVKSQQADRGDDARLITILANASLAGRTLDHQAKLETKVLALKAEDVLNAMKRHIDPEKLFNVIAGDLKSAK